MPLNILNCFFCSVDRYKVTALVILLSIIAPASNASNGVYSVNGYVTQNHNATNFRSRKDGSSVNYGSHFVVTNERENVSNAGTLYLDRGASGSYNFAVNTATTPVNSYMVFLNSDHNNQSDRTSKIGQIIFDYEILGVYFDRSDTIYKANISKSGGSYPGTTYARDYESHTFYANTTSSSTSSSDWVSVGGTGNKTLRTGSKNGNPGDYIRVITKAAPQAPTVDFRVSSSSGWEYTSSAYLYVDLSNSYTSWVYVPYSVTGTATSGSDYTLSNGVLAIYPGATESYIQIANIVNDTLDEANETVVVTLGTPTNATRGSPYVHTYTIYDNDASPSLSIDDVTITEADTSDTFTVTLSAASGQQVTVDYALSDVTTTSGTDYTAVSSGTLTFIAGQTSKTITVPILEDALDEANETATMTLSNVSSTATISDPTGTLTITDDDTAPIVDFNTTTSSGAESVPSKAITVDLSAASGQDVTVSYTVTGTATGSGTDYTLANGTLTIPAGSTTGTITIAGIADDSIGEVDETVILTLSSPGNATLGTDTVHTYTITDNDAFVAFTIDAIADVTVNENTAYTSVTPSLTGTPVGTVTYTISGTDATDFSIDSSTGVVSMIARDFENPVDSDTSNNYELTITATDEDGNTDTEDWVVSVLDVNETVSFTIDAITDLTINENTAYTSVTPNLSGGTPIGTVTYTISGTDAADFSINSSTGVVTMVARDYENPVDDGANNTYNLTITATDEDGNNDSEGWVVSVVDVTETASFTIDAIADLTIDEGTVYTSVTPAITGTTIGSVTYTISGTDAADFSINSSTGVVTMVARDFANPVDEDTSNNYELTITATDEDGNNDSEGWVVSVIETVTFTIDPIADLTVSENAVYTSVTPSLSGGTPVGSVTYTISGGADADKFTINSSTGVVTMAARDFDNPVDVGANNTYNLTITATDEANNTGTEGWVVSVVDSQAPNVSFAHGANSTNTLETSNTYTIYVRLYREVNGVHTWIPWNDPNPTTSDISIPYTVTGTATGSGTDYTMADGTLTIPAGSVAGPIYLSTIEDTLSEADETVIITLSANPTNATLGLYPVYTFTIRNDDASPSLSIDDVTHAEATSTATFTVTLSSASSSDVTVNYATSDGTATTADDDYTATSGTVTIPANATTATFTVFVHGDSRDEADETVTLTLSGASGASISDATGILTITDNDNPPSVDFNTSSSSGLESVSSKEITVDLSAASGSDVTVNYAVTGTATGSGTDYTLANGALTIPAGSTTGTITIAGIVDDINVEDNETVIVTLSSPSNATLGTDTVHTYTIINNDVTKIGAAVFTIDDIVNVTVDENTAYTSVTPSLTGTPVGSVTYTIIGGADANKFTINSSTGVVSMVARDFENPVDDGANNTYEVIIQATDSNLDFDTEDWVVSVLDVTETVSFTINPIADLTINENTAYTSVTPAITGTPIGTVTYTFTVLALDKFTIDSSTGVVSMVARDFENPVDVDWVLSSIYPYETDNAYIAAITATDEDGNTDSVAWGVVVLNVNEEATFTIDAIADVTINENTAYTSVTPNLSGDTPVGTVTYTISGTDAADFSIDSSTGIVTMVARDFESPEDADTNNTYNLTITATDSDGNNDSEDWVVSVVDTTELATFTINAIADVNVNENTAYTSVTPAITGTPIGTVTYTISGTDSDKFTIDSSSGVVSMIARDFENPVDADTSNTYDLTITATDSDGNTSTNSESWVVSVVDVTETVSFTIDAIADITVDENTVYISVNPVITGTPIGIVTATISGTDADKFTVNSLSGVVTMVARDFENPVDGDTSNTYEITLTATDSDGNTDSEDWVVSVVDVNEEATFTIDAIADVTINENTAYTSVTPNLSGDTPIGTVTYTISGTDAADFSINSSTGVVTMVARDYENPEDVDTNNTYNLTITATDEDNNTDTESWVVSIVDVTETASFTINAIDDVNVNENTAYSSVTPAITGTPIGTVTYTLGGTDAADFSINSSTGVVSMVARDFENPVDGDTSNTYVFFITATDEDGNTDTESWVVSVVDVTETVSFTINAIDDLTVNENTAYTSVTPAITGTPIGTVTYTISGTDAADFSIDSSTGVVTMVARDYESPADNGVNNTYNLTITATDSDNNTDSEAWVVSVLDVTETVTFAIDLIADVTVNENTAYTSVTPNLSGDTPIGTVTYTISGTDAADFSINSSTGVVTMVARDYENPEDVDTNNTYNLTITATDEDGNTDTESWVVSIVDVTETASFTINAIDDVNVNENTAYSSVTPAITGTPIGTVTYTLGGTDAADFSINSSTGVVTMVARDFENPVDADTSNTYVFFITATDEDGNTDTESWVVSVVDVTETVSFTIVPIDWVNIDENEPYTSVTPAITGTPIGTVTYTISGTDAADFSIDSSTGVVTMVARDFENPVDDGANNTYDLTIIATDEDGNTASEPWAVNMHDVAETVSFTIDAIADVTVNENTAYISVTPNLSGDTPIGTVTYTISGTDAADFSIDSSTGIVTMVARDYENPVDDGANNTYNLTITATDSDGNSDTEDWVVSVANSNESVIFTINSIDDVNVNENTAYSSVTPSLSGGTPVGSVTYTISGTDAADFSINSSTGVVTMVARDFENPVDGDTSNTYDLTITATDEDGNTSTNAESWVVSVTDVTETVTFAIVPIDWVNIDENEPYTSVTPAITGTPIGTVTYTLDTDSADDDKFTIDPSTGVVSMIARDFENPVDADTNNTYDLTIIATDEDGNTASEPWAVNMHDVAETVSFTIDAIADLTINENTAYISVTPNLSGDTPIGTVTYTISGTDAADFSIDSSTGVVTMVARDFESPEDADTNNTYNLTITATDSDGNNDSEDWVVSVVDTTELATFTINAIDDVNVNENTAYTSDTPAITGTPIGTVTYTISGTDAADFSIDSSTGVVTMVARDFENPEDADTSNTYNLTITATDEDGNTDTEDWVVSVVDVAETVSFTINSIDDVNVNENTAYTSVTPNLSGDTPVGTVTYTISGTDAADFSIDSSTGIVTMVARDFESPEDADTSNTYNLTITATDSDGNNDSEDWVVSVVDTTELATFTINAIDNVNVNENTAYTSVTPAITGTPIGTVTYTLGGTDAADFSINSSTGVVTMVARDFESPEDADTSNTYNLTITATDSDGNNDSEDWVVSVVDTTELATFTINAIADVTVNENTAYTSVTPVITGTPIGTVTYTLGGTDAADFSINSSTGVVTMVARDYENPVDDDTSNTYVFFITATDEDGNTDTESWLVSVVDVTETSEFTINAIDDVSVNENTAYTSDTPAITGTPIGTVTYTISGTDSDNFTIDSSSGIVTMVFRDFENPEDADTSNTYDLTITATDEDGNTATEDWVVSVVDVAETVSFTIDVIADLTINENTAYSSVTPNLSGGTPIGSITYTLGGTDASDFSIDSSTGVVTMVARDFENPEDADTSNTYDLTITATDEDGNTDTEGWVVSVVDLTEIVSFTIDAIDDTTINENISYTSDSPSLSGDTPIGTVTFAISGADASDFSIDPSSGIVTMVARDYENPVDADNSNTYDIVIAASDEDGNTSTNTEPWCVTVSNYTVPPTVTITSSEVNDGDSSAHPTISVSFTLSEIATDFVVGDVVVTNGTLSGFTGSGKVYTATFTPTEDGPTTINIAASTFTDAESNANTVADEFNWNYYSQLSDPTIKKDVVSFIGAWSDIATRWGNINVNAIHDRLTWLERNKHNGMTSHQGIKIKFADERLDKIMNTPSGNAEFDLNSIRNNVVASLGGNENCFGNDNELIDQPLNGNAACDNGSYKETQDVLNSLESEIQSVALNEAKKIRESAIGTLNPVFEPIVNDWSMWTSGVLTVGKNIETSIESTQKTYSQSLHLGFDRSTDGRDGVVGFALGIGYDKTDVGEDISNVKSTNYSLSAYGEIYPQEDNTLEGVIGLGHLKFDTTRKDDIDTLTGKRDANQLFGSLKWKGKYDGTVKYEGTANEDEWTVHPYGKIEASRTKFKEFSENNTAVTALTFKEQNLTNVRGSIGVDAHYLRNNDKNTVSPFLNLEYGEKVIYSSDAPLHYSTMAGANTHNILLDEKSKNDLKVGLGIGVVTDDDFNAVVGYKRTEQIDNFSGWGKNYNDQVYLELEWEFASCYGWWDKDKVCFIDPHATTDNTPNVFDIGGKAVTFENQSYDHIELLLDREIVNILANAATQNVQAYPLSK